MTSTAAPTTTSPTSVHSPLPWQMVTLSIPDEYYLLLSGGRGGGKSTCLCMLILRDAIRFGKGFVGVLVRRDLAGLQKLQKEISDQMGAIPELKGSRWLAGSKEFRFSTGASLVLHYIKDEQAFNRFQGSDLTHVYIDEAGQIAEPGPILKLCSSMRTTDPAITPRLVLTANSNNIGSWWLYENIVSRLVPWKPAYVELFKREMVFVQSTLFDNTHLQDREAYIQALRASCNFDEARIQSEVYGRWGVTSGSFFGHVFDKQRQELLPIGGLPTEDPDYQIGNVWLAMDWGTRSPAAVALMYRMKSAGYWGGKYLGAGSIVLVDALHTNIRSPDGKELWNVGDRTLTTSKMAALVKDLCARNGCRLEDVFTTHRVADAAIGAKIGSRDGSIGDQLKSCGAGFVAAPKGARAPGWQMLARLMEAAGDPSAPGFYICSNVTAWWQTIPTLVYDQTNPEDLDSAGVDHLADAVRYGITAMQDLRYSGGVIGGKSLRVY